MDSINRKAWSDRDSVKHFESLDGWTDPGEQIATALIAPEVADQPILDLGVGAGRTVPLFRKISRDYTALDYTLELVEACRRRHPRVTVLHGDARDLSRFPDSSFKLVAFSFNGIDAVNPEDRLKILHEVYRVLRPGGIFFFSAHNIEGPGHREKLNFGIYWSKNPFKVMVRSARALLHVRRTLNNYRNLSALSVQADGYSLRNASAHDHGIVIHYISLEKQQRQLESVGFQPGALAYSNLGGPPVFEGDDTRQMWWFHFLARK